MATTIGRVEFIVGLDGNKLPAQARKLANQIAAAGTKGGKDFGKNFESAFDESLSKFGQRFASQLSKDGKLAAERFSTTMERTLKSRFSSMQGEIAQIFSDSDIFKGYVDDIGDIDEASGKLRASLEQLRNETVVYEDSLGRVRTTSVLTAKAHRDLEVQLRRLVDEYKVNAAEAERLAAAQEDLDANLRRLIRTAGDSDAFGKMADRVGGTSVAFARLKAELEGVGEAMGRSRGDIEEWVDTLEKTRDSVDRANANVGTLDTRVQRLHKTFAKLQKLNPFKALDKDVQLVIAAIAGAAPEIAALSSALGAGLIAVGGAAASAVTGVLALVATFSNLNQEIEDAPAAMKPAIRSFGRFKEALGDVNDAIAQAAFDEMGASFDTLDDNVRALSPSLEKVGTSLGKLIKGFADGTRKGTDAFEEIDKAIQNAGPNLESLGEIAGQFGTALVRAFNRAQPLVEDMFGWLGKLTDRFDRFTQSDNFADWVENSQRVWSAFSGTLDAVSRALNDLVTPQAIDNTVKLLENLERLAPSIGNLLEIIGALDPIGLLVDILADIGEVLAPLTPLMVTFASGLNDVVEAVPPGAWVALAGGITLVGGALTTLKVASFVKKQLEPLIPTLTSMFATLKPMPDAITGVSKGLSTLGKAGVIGAAVVGFIALTEAAKDWAREIANIDGIVKKAVKGNQSLISTIDQLSGVADGLSKPFKDIDGAFESLSRWQSGNIFERMGAALDTSTSGAHDLNAALNELDKGLKGLPLEDQAEKFSGWAKELKATDKQVLQMLDSMPEFKSSLEDAALAEDGVADSADLVRLALGRQAPAVEGSLDAFAQLTGELTDGASAAELQADALELLTGKSLAALDAVEGVSDGIKTLGSAFRDQQSATLDYEASLDDLSASLEENGRVWDVSSEAGRANQQAVMDLAEATLNLASEQYNLTGSSEDAAASISAGREAVIKAVEGMDLGGLSAEEYADKLGLIPEDVDTLISANTAAGMEMADAFATRLYELGLIEVNPVLALDAVDAQAEADRIQAELDGLTVTPHTATLDANGDPISAVIDTEASKLATFASSSYTTTLDANGDPAGAVLESTANKMSTFGKQTFTPTLDVNNLPGTAKVSATEKKLDSLDSQTFIPKLDVNDTKAKDKTKSTTDQLLRLDGSIYTPDIDVDNKDALSGAAAVKSSLDRLPTNKTITITTVHRSVTQDNRAAGGIASSPTLSVWGEAGPEALVPLRRPLSQVDPAVRALSAIAQGKMSYGEFGSSTGSSAGVSAAASRVVNIESGAIVVQGSLAPEATATMTVNRIAERIGA